MHMTHCSGSTVWHECVSECVCTCDCVFVDTHMCNSVEEHIIHNPYCLAPVVASEALNIRDTVMKGDDAELEQSKWLNMLDTGRTWESVCLRGIK